MMITHVTRGSFLFLNLFKSPALNKEGGEPVCNETKFVFSWIAYTLVKSWELLSFR